MPTSEELQQEKENIQEDIMQAICDNKATTAQVQAKAAEVEMI